MAGKFNRDTTAEEIANAYDLSGKNVIVTGGYSGTFSILSTLYVLLSYFLLINMQGYLQKGVLRYSR